MFCGNAAECHQGGDVDGAGIVHNGANNLLDSADAIGWQLCVGVMGDRKLCVGAEASWRGDMWAMLWAHGGFVGKAR